MKKIFYTLIYSLMVIALPSCNFDKNEKDGSGELTTSQLIIGSWKTDKYEWTELVNGKVQESGTVYFDDNDYMLWTYRADGSFVDMTIEEGVAYKYKGTWVATSSKLFMTYEEELLGEKMEWSENYKISSVNRTKFVIEFIDTELDEDGTKYEYITEYTFTKQE